MNNIFLFHGTDSFSIHEKVQNWRKAFLKKHDLSSLEIIEGKRLKLNQFKMHALSLPFLADKKLLILKDFFTHNKAEQLNEMKEIILQIPDSTVLVFQENKSADKRTSLYKNLKKDHTVEEFTLPEKYELQTWIKNRADKKGLKLSKQTANFLSTYLKADLWQIDKQLEQLKQYANKQEITKKHITDLLPASLQTNIFLLTDYLSERKTTQTLKILNQLLQSGEDPFKIFHLIIRQFRLLLRTSILKQQGLNSSEIQKALKLHPFVAKKITQQIKHFTLPQLKSIFKQLLQIDLQIKTGKIRTYPQDYTQFLLALEKLIVCC